LCRSAERVSSITWQGGNQVDDLADFQAKNVEQDLNRLLDDSHSGAALRKSLPPPLLSEVSLTSSRIRTHSSDVRPQRRLDLPFPPLGPSPHWSITIVPPRPIAIYETGRFGRQGIEPHPRSERIGWEQEYEFAWVTEQVQDWPGEEIAREVVEATFGEST
jgi:hypothetical protein